MARGDRSVDVFVREVRHKLEMLSPDWRYIHTHFGVGYRFTPESPRHTCPGLQPGQRPSRAVRGARAEGDEGEISVGALGQPTRARLARM
jgi:Transcriptional regulatory protein, C terminal